MSALAAAAPDLPLTLFDDDGTASSLTKLRAGKPLIIDFWTTRCERCPACLDKLDKIAESLGDKVVFAASSSEPDAELGGLANVLRAFQDTRTFMCAAPIEPGRRTAPPLTPPRIRRRRYGEAEATKLSLSLAAPLFTKSMCKLYGDSVRPHDRRHMHDDM